MRPMGRFVLGLVIVGLDISWEGVDLLADPVGWLLAALALREVAPRHPMLRVAAGCAWAAAAVSAVTWVPVWGDPPDLPWLLVALDTLLDAAVVVTVCSALVHLLAPSDPFAARQAGVIRWLDPVLAVGGLALGAWALRAYPGGEPAGVEAGPLTPLAVLLLVAVIAVRIWFLVLVFRHSEAVDSAGTTVDHATPAAS